MFFKSDTNLTKTLAMADPGVADPIPPDPNLTTTTTTTEFDALPIPPLDPFIFSDTFISDLGGPFDDDVEDFVFDFTFDDLYLPSDTEGCLSSLPAPIDPFGSDPLQFTDLTPDVSRISDPACFDQISGDQSSNRARVLNSPLPGSCQVSFDRCSDVLKILNASSPESSQESGNKSSDISRVLNCPSLESETNNLEVYGPALSQGSGNSRSAVSEALNYLSTDSGNCARSASSPNFSNNSINGIVDQKIKLDEEGNNYFLKRKKESEDGNSEWRTSKCQRSNAGDNPNPLYVLSGTSEEGDKRKARLMRNRESAQLSRQRKKHYVEELEDKVRAMQSTIHDLNTNISYIMAENMSLRHQLSGGAMCLPQVPPLGMYQHPPMAPMVYPWMTSPPYVVKPQGSQVPLVPIPRLKPQQPASTPKAKKIESKKTEGRTKKVASVSFLGLLFFILLFGGLVPMVNVKFGGMWETVPGGSDYFGDMFYEQHHGRVVTVNGHLNSSDQNIGMGLSSGRLGIGNNLTNIIHCGRIRRAKSNVEQKELGIVQGSQHFPGLDRFVRPGNSSEPLVASLYVPRNDKLVKIDGNLIIHSVLASEKAVASRQDPGMKSSKETGLAVLGNMAPPILITGRNNGRHPHLYRSPSERQRALGSGSADRDNSKSIAADGKLQQWFREGLAGPKLSSGMCTEVFQFDISPAPGAIVPGASVMNVSAEHRQNATQLIKGRNRRILHSAPIPLAGSRSNIAKEHVGRNPGKDNFHGNSSLPSMVVSVLVDPREADDGDSDGVRGPKLLSRIFVVVLIDSVKYVTYSCILPLMQSGAPLVTT